MQRTVVHPSTAALSRKVNGREAQIEGMTPKKLLINKSRELNRVNTCNDKGSSVT